MLDSMWFEVEYMDGHTASETTGLTYSTIDRANLKFFRIVDKTGPVIELETDGSRTGWNIIWRKRTVERDGKRATVYLTGWVPNGPLFAVDEVTERIYQAAHFVPGDPMFYPPVPNPRQNERWQIANPTRIVNPSLERTS